MQTINIENVVNSAMTEISRGQKLLSQVATDRLTHMNKIKLKLNDKTPINKWKRQTNQFKTVDVQKYNIGIPTGKLNNIFVLDVDKLKEHKKELDGMAKIKEFGPIDTFTVKKLHQAELITISNYQAPPKTLTLLSNITYIPEQGLVVILSISEMKTVIL